jgi:hypothetical protein
VISVRSSCVRDDDDCGIVCTRSSSKQRKGCEQNRCIRIVLRTIGLCVRLVISGRVSVSQHKKSWKTVHPRFYVILRTSINGAKPSQRHSWQHNPKLMRSHNGGAWHQCQQQFCWWHIHQMKLLLDQYSECNTR